MDYIIKISPEKMQMFRKNLKKLMKTFTDKVKLQGSCPCFKYCLILIVLCPCQIGFEDTKYL